MLKATTILAWLVIAVLCLGIMLKYMPNAATILAWLMPVALTLGAMIKYKKPRRSRVSTRGRQAE